MSRPVEPMLCRNRILAATSKSFKPGSSVFALFNIKWYGDQFKLYIDTINTCRFSNMVFVETQKL